MDNSVLRTFVLTHNKEIISPALVTIREYKNWFEKTFDEYTIRAELYLKSKRGTESVLECHPGTKIGKYFDTHDFRSEKLHCWYIAQDSTMMRKLVDYKMAELIDTTKVSFFGHEDDNMLRVYTTAQIQCYLQTSIHKTFSISKYIDMSRHVPVDDLDNLVQPKIATKRRTLV